MKHRLPPARRAAPVAAALVVAGCAAGMWWIVDDASIANAAMATAQASDKNCDDFPTRRDAQDYFDSMGYSAGNDPERLDDSSGAGDGVACEGLPTVPPADTYRPVPADPADDVDRQAVDEDRVNAK